MLKSFVAFASVLAFSQFATNHPATAQNASITIDAARVLGLAQPLIFGHNVEAGDSYGIFGDQHSYSSRDGSGMWNPQTRAPVPELLQLARDVDMKLLRYPGGCLAHNFNWKDAIGPVAERPNFAFGIDEWIEFCRQSQSEPLMNVSDYAATPQEAADLVEYLNAPADDAHPWAQKRALWGHHRPFGVKYFEMGNETDHGNHDLQPPRKWTAQQYAAWFNECAQKMKAIDAKIKIGALTGTGTGPDDPWNAVVLSQTKEYTDFIIIHTYTVGIWSQDQAVKLPADLLMRAALASVDQTETMLARYRVLIRQHTGRELPLAITEYNASFVQDEPKPYRFSYGAALFAADYLRVLLKPQNHVLMANYWQFANGYWGMVRKDEQTWRKQPAYYLFRLWGQHFDARPGARIVNTEVTTPRIEFEGLPGGKVRPAHGAKYQPKLIRGDMDLWKNHAFNATQENSLTTENLPDGTLRATVRNATGEHYPKLATVKTLPSHGYFISFEARSSAELAPTSIGLGLTDARGWADIKSGIAVEGAQNAREWTKFEATFDSLADAPGADIVWRLRLGETPVSGTLEVRNLRIMPYRAENFAAYAALTATASLAPDGRKLSLIVFNKDGKHDLVTQLNLRGFKAQRARRWTVSGPTLDALNTETEEVRETESDVPTPLENAGTIRHTFPARSMTAIELTR